MRQWDQLKRSEYQAYPLEQNKCTQPGSFSQTQYRTSGPQLLPASISISSPAQPSPAYLTLGPGSRNPSSNHARQLLAAHTIHHTHHPHHHGRHEDAKTGKQEERHADVLPFARGPAPLHGLAVLAVLAVAHDRGAALAREALFGLGIAGAVPTAAVGLFRAVGFVEEAGGEVGAKGWEAVAGIRRGGVGLLRRRDG